MKNNLLTQEKDYWDVAKVLKDLYMSESSLSTLLDFERVLDEIDIYAFKYWEIGELVQGPEINKYKVECTFMWPRNKMPDPRGAKRLIPFDCDVEYKKSVMQVPGPIKDPSDYRPGTRKANLKEHKIWLVSISMPKSLMSEIKTGSIELENQEIDLADLDDAYNEDLDQQQYQTQDTQQPAPVAPMQGGM
jgi:hypothetical protein